MDEFIGNVPRSNSVLESMKDELELKFNDFNEPAIKKGLFATAQLIHNLCFLIPGTYPDTPEMGINIKQYQFEYLTETDLQRIREKIVDQIKTYLPDSNVGEIVTKVVTDPKSQLKSLGIGFAIMTQSAPETFFIFFQDNPTGSIVSNIIF